MRMIAWAGLALATAASAQPDGRMPTVPPTPVSGARSASAALPLEAFAHLPRLTQAALSPDGRRVAELRHLDDETQLVTRDPDRETGVQVVMRTDQRRFTILWFRWVNDERLLVVTSGVGVGLMQIDHGEVGMISVRADGSGAFRILERLSDFGPMGGTVPGSYVGVSLPSRVVDWMPDDGHRLMVEIVEPGNVDPSVFLVNVDDNGHKRIFRERPDLSHWIADADHHVRVGLRQRDGDIAVMVCDPDGTHWRIAWRFRQLSQETVWPLGFGKDPNLLYVTADHQGRTAVFEVDLRDPALKRRLKYSHPVFDVGGVLLRSRASGEVIGVSRQTSEPMDSPAAQDSGRASIWADEYRRIYAEVDQALPNRFNEILSWSRDERRLLVHSIANGRPERFTVVTRPTSGPLQLQPLTDPYPDLPATQLAGKRPVRVQARDGRLLVALLTLPPGAADSGLPAVVMPHGGPQWADDAGFDPWVEFLASRGYAVLQLNFRGSTGEGWELLAAGLQRWGLEMQDDLTDATQWLVRSGVADPRRIAIVGASYGGYAALMGAAKTPELYRCAVSLAGVTDLVELARRFWDTPQRRLAFERQIGDPERDRDRLLATSPARLASRIQVPVLMLHGTEDATVPFSQSEAMAQALRDAGKPHRLVPLAQGDHALSRNAHRILFLRELDAFLAEHLGNTAAANAPPTASAAQAGRPPPH
jgi:dipeptidyl aminopeptidase/acylaminoacyl peptidase